MYPHCGGFRLRMPARPFSFPPGLELPAEKLAPEPQRPIGIIRRKLHKHDGGGRYCAALRMSLRPRHDVPAAGDRSVVGQLEHGQLLLAADLLEPRTPALREEAEAVALREHHRLV